MSEQSNARLGPIEHPGVGYLERVPADLFQSFTPNQAIQATPDFHLERWQDEEVFVHCVAGLGVGRAGFSHPGEVRLAMQSPSQQRKYLVRPVTAGVFVDGVPYSPMGITVKGILLTQEMMYARANVKRPSRVRPAVITQRLVNSGYAEGVANDITAEADTIIPNIMAHALPVPRVIMTGEINEERVTPWLSHKVRATGSPYPVIEQIAKAPTEAYPMVLIEQAEDDVRNIDYSPDYGTMRTSGPYSFPRLAERSAAAFLREVAYLDGPHTHYPTRFLELYGSDALAAPQLQLTTALYNISRGSFQAKDLRAYYMLVAAEIGRTYGVLQTLTPAIQDAMEMTIGLPAPYDYQNWSSRGRFHDYETLLGGIPETDRDAHTLALQCVEYQVQQISSLFRQMDMRSIRQAYGPVATEAFWYARQHNT